MAGQLAAQPTPAARITWTSSISNGNQQRSSLEQSIGQLEGRYISTQPYDDINRGAGHNGGTILPGAPLVQNEMERATDGSYDVANTVTATWQPRPWLPLNGTGGFNTIQRTDETYIPYGVNSCSTRSNSDPNNVGNCDSTGSFGAGHGTSNNITLVAGTAMPFFSQRLTLALGGNVYNQSTNDIRVYTPTSLRQG